MSSNTYIVTTGIGVNREHRRYPLENVEAFFSKDKYVMARMTDGAEVFPAILQSPRETFHREDHGVVTLRNIEGWLARIGNRDFVRVHRGWLANMKHVVCYRTPSPSKAGAYKGVELITDKGRVILASRRNTVTTKRAFTQGASA